MISRHLLRLALVLALLPFSTGLAAAEGYPLSDPPLIALGVRDVATLRSLLALPHLAQVDAMQALIAPGRPAPGRVVALLEKMGVSELQLLLLAPLADPPNLVLSLKTSLAPERALQVLAEFGQAQEPLSTQSARLARVQMPGMKKPLFVLQRNERLLLGPSPEALLLFGGPALADKARQPWLQTLEQVLDAEPGVVAAWINLPWVADASQALSMPMVWRDRLADTLRRVRLMQGELPPAILMHLRPEPPEMLLTLPLEKPPGRAAEPAPSLPLHAAFPTQIEAMVRVSPLVQTDSGIRDITGGRDPWSLVEAAAEVMAPEEFAQTSQLLRALQMLVGLHPDRDLLRRLTGQGAFGFWRDKQSETRQALVLAGDFSDTAALERALAWAAFFAEKDDQPLTHAPVAAVDGWGREVVGAWEGMRLALIATARYLIVADRADTALLSHERLQEALVSGGTARVVPDAWVQWSLQPAEQTRSALVASLARQAMPLRSGEDFGRMAARAALQANLAGLLEPEGGTVFGSSQGLHLRVRGECLPLTTLASVLALEPLLPQEPSHRAGTAGAVLFLRHLVEAQRNYRWLELARRNNRSQATFAQSGRELVAGKGEGSRSLAEWFDERHLLSEYAAFSDLLHAVDAGEGFFGYTYRFLDRIDDRELDPAREWAVVAEPRSRAAPILLVREDGTIWYRPAGVQIDAVPEDPAAAGWGTW